jgi:hypothetical protein
MPNYPPLQLIGAAVYSRLNGDATLAALAASDDDTVVVVNDEAEDQSHPFVLIPGAGAQPWNTLGSAYGWQCELTPIVYSRYEGDLEAIQIAERVIALLNDYTLSITGYTTVICELDPDASPLPVKVKMEYPQKIERRALSIRFQIKVHE